MLWPAAYQQKVCYRLLKTEEEERGGCTFEGIKSEGRSAQNTVETLNDGWCDREGLDGGRWSAVTTAKGRSWKKTTATLTVNYHFSDYTCVWLVNMSALRWGIFNISFTLTAVTLWQHISTRILENCVENGWRGRFTAAYHSQDTCKKGLYKKTKQKKIVQKLRCVSYHHQHPQQVVFVNVHVYGTTELKRAEKHYETTCVQHPPAHPPFLRSSSHYPINKKMAWFHLADLVSGFLVLCKLAHWVTWKTWLLFVLLVTPVLTYYESQP